MDENTDAPEGAAESLTIDQAAAAYAKATATPEPQGQTDTQEEADDGTTTDDETLEAEADGEEADGETEAEDQAEDGEEETGSEQGRFVGDNAKVRLADGTVTTIAELKQGSLRQADYTRKTQEVAEGRKAYETQSAALKQRETQITQREQLALNIIGTFLKEPDPSLVDPNSPNYDPVGYQQQDVQFKQWNRVVSQLQQGLQQSEQTKREEASKSERERADKEWNALTEKLPVLKDSKKADNFAADLKSYLGTFGFEPQDMKSVALDHRLALIADKARRWDALQASKPKVQQKVEGRPPVSKGGKRLSPAENKARQASEALTKLGQSGRLDDAVTAYLATQK